MFIVVLSAAVRQNLLSLQPAADLPATTQNHLAIDAINNHVSGGALYKALKEIRKLMKREGELLAAA